MSTRSFKACMAAGLAWGASVASAQRIIHMYDLDWTMGNGGNVSSIPASHPSVAHLDLLREGIIDDPLYGQNDVNQLWVQRSNWTYTSAPITDLITENIASYWMVFKGLDTFAHIEICGKSVGDTDNQFRNYAFDVTKILKNCPQDPVVKMNFGSASEIALERAANGDQTINDANGFEDEEFQGRWYARKEQNDFGWDWSPSFAPAGPWQAGEVVQLLKGGWFYIRNVLTDVYREGQLNNVRPDQSAPWVFNMSVDYLGQLPPGVSMHLTLTDYYDKSVVLRSKLRNVHSNNETVTGITTIDPAMVETWWPVGMGAQPLYVATVLVKGADGKTYSSVDRRIGFRTVVLNLDPVSDAQIAAGVAPGSNWQFEVNGQPFYAKGSNLVPPDPFWPRVNETQIRQLFRAAVDGNQNMLRVWSSGAYLPDFVYNVADEFGILMWSEFEFTYAQYPASKNFLANYEAEASHQVRRLNHHPSLALWAGGNELEKLILEDFNDPSSKIFQNYEKIFTELLIKVVYANTRATSYIPSSTYNGYTKLDFKAVQPQTPRYDAKDSPDAIHGNTDYYNYDASQAFDQSVYPVGKFATEFGFISMPSVQSWREAIPANQFSLSAPQVLHRNRHYAGTGTKEQQSAAGLAEMIKGVQLYYPQPNKADPVANFSSWSYATQVFQADYYQHQIAFYRRGSGMPERNMGSLYWQLNDLWVAPTWSSIEANGRPKASYYSTRDAYKPVVIFPYLDVKSKTLEVWVTSDLFSATSGVAKFSWVNYAGATIKIAAAGDTAQPISGSNNNFRVPFDVGAVNATKILTYDKLYALFADPVTADDALLRMSLTANDGQNRHVSYFHPLSLAKSALRDPKLRLTNDGSGGFTVTASAAVAAWVWLDFESSQVKGYFRDNGFWLNKGESKTVGFKVWEDWTGDGSWVDSVTVRSMWDLTTK